MIAAYMASSLAAPAGAATIAAGAAARAATGATLIATASLFGAALRPRPSCGAAWMLSRSSRTSTRPEPSSTSMS
ncbi:hypothetical protein D3C71_2054720 [compost metagenome]